MNGRPQGLPAELDEIEDTIRLGKTQAADSMLKAFVVRKRQAKEDLRPVLWKVAQLSRRCGDYVFAVRLLHSHVQSESLGRPFGRLGDGGGGPPSAAEQAEYAIALLNLGGVIEARAILHETNETQYAPTELYRVFTDFTLWDYIAAEARLRTLYEKSEEASYQKTLIGVNWLSSLSYTRKWDEALAVAEELKSNIEMTKTSLLNANILEIETQVHLFKRDFARAQRCIEKAEDILSHHRGADRLYLERWKVLLPILKNRAHSLSSRPMLSSSSEAIDLVRRAYSHGEMEAGRVLEFHLLEAFPDEKEIRRLYHSSSSPGFHLVLDLHFGSMPQGPNGEGPPFAHQLSWLGHERPRRILELERKMEREMENRDGASSEDSELTKLENKLLSVLMSDSYRVQSVPALYFSVTGGRFFHPEASPNMIHQLLSRFRKKMKMKKAGWPVSVEFHRPGGFYLKSDHAIATSPLSSVEAPAPRLKKLIQELRLRFGQEEFAFSDVPPLYPERTLKRYLAIACKDGLLFRRGKNKGARYRLATGPMASCLSGRRCF